MFRRLVNDFQGIGEVFRDLRANGVSTVAALGKSVKTLWDNLSVFTKASITAAAIFAAFKLLDGVIVTTEEAIEKHEELASKFRETANEAQTLEDELQSVRDKLDQLNSADNPSLINEEEINKLEASKELLEKQLEYKTELAKYEREQAADAAYDALTHSSIFENNPLAELGSMRKNLDSLENSRLSYYDMLATLDPGSSQYTTVQKNIDNLNSRISALKIQISEAELNTLNLYQSLLDDSGNVLKADHFDLVARVRILLGLDEGSVEQTTDNANDVAEQVSGALGGAIKDAFDSEAQESMDKTVDGFQTSLSSLLSALEKLQSGELGASDVVDLMQEFPALAPYIDMAADGFGNLEDGLRNLIKESPDSVISTLREFKNTYALTEDQASVIDSLCDAFRMMSITADDAKNATKDLMTELQKLGAGGSVNLTTRPAVNTNELVKAGWDVEPNEIATVFSSTFSNEDGTVAVNFTPIIVDENGTYIGTLSEDELTEYAEGVIAGTRKDDLHLKIGSEFTGDDAIEQAEFAAERIHDLHESLFFDGAYSSVIDNFAPIAEKINAISDSMKTVADLQNEVANGFTMSQEKALEFASVYPEILNGATVTADGQIALNEDVVNSFIRGKEAEFNVGVNALILGLESEKEALLAKKAFAEAQLKLAQSVGEGEGRISQEVAEYRVRAGNAVAEALVNAGVQEADAYKLACAAMAGNAEEFNSVAADVCTDVQGNFNNAAYNAAQAIYLNMNRAKLDLSSLTSQAHEAGKAIAGVGSGVVSGSTAIKAGSNGGTRVNKWTPIEATGSFVGTDFHYEAIEFELDEFISQLELDISEYENAISQIDGQIAVLKALRERDLGSFKSDKSSSGGNKEADEAISAAEEALRNEFKDYLNDMEHLISLMERNNVPEAEIVDSYTRMMEAVHAEAERARANGEDENSDYIQELQNQWWKYHDAIQGIRDELTKNAKSVVDELVDYRLDMLKQELEDEKNALDERLDQLKEFYDEQKEMLREQYDEEKYLEEQAEKRKAVSDIEAEIDSLRYDDSAWAQKRRAELEAELADARKDLEDFEKENALDEVEKLLDEQYEQQAALIQSQIDAIEAQLNDPEALFNQALADIKNSTEALYQEMVAYNAAHGDGNPETVKQFWEEAYSALQEYFELFGEAYEGVSIENATGYESQHGFVNIGGSDSGSSPGDSNASSGEADSGIGGASSGSSDTASSATAPALEKGSYVQVKDGVKWYSDSNGGGKWGYAKPGKIKYISENGTHPYNIDGAGWVRKEDIVGYASGTSNATAGLHEFGERGDEFIFTSGDGRKYRIFSDGEKVLNAGATNFLYDFANSYGESMRNVWDSLVGSILQQVGKVGSRETSVEIHAGDIVVQGNADERTVSEIRRIKREQVSFILKEFGKLNK